MEIDRQIFQVPGNTVLIVQYSILQYKHLTEIQIWN
jgi:hypothetical protein